MRGRSPGFDEGNMFISILFIARDMKLTRFEKARIIGARGLQIALGAPVLIEVPENLVDPIEIAKLEFEQGLLAMAAERKGTNTLERLGTKVLERRQRVGHRLDRCPQMLEDAAGIK